MSLNDSDRVAAPGDPSQSHITVTPHDDEVGTLSTALALALLDGDAHALIDTSTASIAPVSPAIFPAFMFSTSLIVTKLERPGDARSVPGIKRSSVTSVDAASRRVR